MSLTGCRIFSGIVHTVNKKRKKPKCSCKKAWNNFLQFTSVTLWLTATGLLKPSFKCLIFQICFVSVAWFKMVWKLNVWRVSSTMRKNKLNRLGAKTFHLNCSIWRLLRFSVHKNGFKHAIVEYCQKLKQWNFLRIYDFRICFDFKESLNSKSGQSSTLLHSRLSKILPEFAWIHQISFKFINTTIRARAANKRLLNLNQP